MSIPITTHDRAIAQAVTFKYRLPDKSDPAGGKISFQFPPKILSDNRKGTWEEGDLFGVEPLAIFATSGPREFSLNWTYIVESKGTIGFWSIGRIRQQVNRIRGYFGNFKAHKSKRESLIVDFKFAAITGPTAWTCRIKSIDVKHSDNLIGDPDFCYPLRTDIIVDLRLWTETAAGDANGADTTPVSGINLKPNPTFNDFWY